MVIILLSILRWQGHLICINIIETLTVLNRRKEYTVLVSWSSPKSNDTVQCDNNCANVEPISVRCSTGNVYTCAEVVNHLQSGR